MANEEHVEQLRHSVSEWNIWRQDHPEMEPDLSGANFSESDLSRADLRWADLRWADLRETNLSFANLDGACFVNANLYCANLRFAHLKSTKFQDANLGSEYEIITPRGEGGPTNNFGADFSHAILILVHFDRARLRSASFNDATLEYVDFKYAFLREISFNNATLKRVSFSHANLSEARFSNTALREGDFYHANLSRARFSNTALEHVSFSHANLSEARFSNVNFSRTRFWKTIFAQVDLGNTKGLETTIHEGPSILDINSVILPTDEHTRNHFLRGVGFTETQIEYLPSLLTPRPIEYSSLFISYAHQDEIIAKRLYDDLRKKDVPCWFAVHDLRPGTPLMRGIEEAIHKQDKLLLILSHYAVASNWVQYEVEAALHKQAVSGRETLFPIRLDNSVLQINTQWAKRLCKYHVGDFTNWQDGTAYQQAFTKLLQHLKVVKPPVS